MTVIGLILSGGSGERLGRVRKGDLRIGNTTLKTRVAHRVGPSCDALLFSTGSSNTLPPSGALSLPDDPAGITGPAAGLMAGALWCLANAPDATLVSVSVDTPFYPSDYVKRAAPLLLPRLGCVVARHGDRDYPTIALWRVPELAALLKSIPPAPRGPRIRDIQRQLGCAFLDYSVVSQDNPFLGINRVAELLQLSKRAETMDRDNVEIGVGKRGQIG